jgi:hypothetical protein
MCGIGSDARGLLKERLLRGSRRLVAIMIVCAARCRRLKSEEDDDARRPDYALYHLFVVLCAPVCDNS